MPLANLSRVPETSYHFTISKRKTLARTPADADLPALFLPPNLSLSIFARSHCYEHLDPQQAFPDDGAGIFHLGSLAAHDFRISPQPWIQPDSADPDPEYLPGRRYCGDVL